MLMGGRGSMELRTGQTNFGLGGLFELMATFSNKAYARCVQARNISLPELLLGTLNEHLTAWQSQ